MIGNTLGKDLLQVMDPRKDTLLAVICWLGALVLLVLGVFLLWLLQDFIRFHLRRKRHDDYEEVACEDKTGTVIGKSIRIVEEQFLDHNAYLPRREHPFIFYTVDGWPADRMFVFFPETTEMYETAKPGMHLNIRVKQLPEGQYYPIHAEFAPVESPASS